MSQRQCILVTGAVLIGVLLSASWLASGAKAAKDEPSEGDEGQLESGIIRSDEARKVTGDWGKMGIFVDGDSKHSANVFAGAAKIKAGKALHPTHKHPGEEFLVLTKGSGEWFLNGESFPAKQGDVMYVEPGDRHGLRNTSDEPLRFFVAKWETKDK